MRTIEYSGLADACIVTLVPQADLRGTFTESFRNEWRLGPEPKQWNLVSSHANVLRGVHLHVRHTDYMIVASGLVTFGWHDLRPESDTRGCSGSLELSGDRQAIVVIPPSVAHGFYAHTPAVQLYGVSEYWSVDDELGCHWADEDLGISWPVETPVLSARDTALPSLHELKRLLAITGLPLQLSL